MIICNNYFIFCKSTEYEIVITNIKQGYNSWLILNNGFVQVDTNIISNWLRHTQINKVIKQA